MTVFKLFLVFGILARVGSQRDPLDNVTEGDANCSYCTPAPNIQEALRKHLIVPELLRFGPQSELEVTYGNDSKVKFGNKFTPEQIEKQPNFLRWPCRRDAFHTLVLTGLDVPTQNSHAEREWKHWILVNIPENNITDGEVIVPYQGPGFSYENGLHRLVFMVYEQPWRHKIYFSESVSKDSPVRPKFDSSRFAEKYDVGQPIAINFLICETNWPKPTRTI